MYYYLIVTKFIILLLRLKVAFILTPVSMIEKFTASSCERYKQGLWVMVFSSLTYTYSLVYIIIGIYDKTTHDMVKGWSVQFRIYFWQTHFEWSCLLVMLNLPVLQNQRLYFLRFGINTGGKRICEKLVKKKMKIKRVLLEKLWSSCLWNINRLVSF